MGFQEELVVVGIGADDVDDAPAKMGWHLLGEAGDMQIGRAGELAGIRRGFANEHAQQGAFARAIGAQQAEAIAAFDVQLDVIQQRMTAETEADTAETK